MKLEIDLSDAFCGDYPQSISQLIEEEIRDAVRRKVKSLLRDKAGEIAKAVEVSAKAHAKKLMDNAMGMTQ